MATEQSAIAKQSDLEKTEPASQRRIEQAREEGQVPRSRELGTFMVMMAGVAGLWLTGGWLTGHLGRLMRGGLSLERHAVFDTAAIPRVLMSSAGDGLLALLPVMGALLVAALAGPFVMGGWNFSPKALAADWTRMDPLKGVARMVSVQGVAELFKALAKSVVVGGVALWVMRNEWDQLLGLVSQPLHVALANTGSVIVFSAMLIISGMALLAAFDVPFQLWQYHSKLKMTKEEARKEMKEMEGDPQLKARIRSQQRELARRRMMSEVPKADVIVTNPTHFAVALKYDAEKMRAPRVVAKGRALVALRIREIGVAHGLPLLEAPPLARALFKHAELGDEIPAALYTAVAEVMAYVYQLNRFATDGGAAPQAPVDLPVPGGMDPGLA